MHAGLTGPKYGQACMNPKHRQVPCLDYGSMVLCNTIRGDTPERKPRGSEYTNTITQGGTIMATFATDPAVMKEKAGVLTQCAEDYERIGRQLQQEATSMGVAYDTADNRNYVSRIEAFCQELQRMAEKLKNAGITLSEQSQMYTIREEENTSAANRLPG